MAEPPTEPFLLIHTQYIKDLSFESPGAPQVFATLAEAAPDLAVHVDLDHVRLQDRTYEVVLSLRAEATAGGGTAFLVELDYGGMVTVGSAVAEADIEPLLMIEAARHLFPFARSALAAVTREGGFPPLILNPIDFEQFYRRRKRAETKAEPGAGPAAAEA